MCQHKFNTSIDTLNPNLASHTLYKPNPPSIFVSLPLPLSLTRQAHQKTCIDTVILLPPQIDNKAYALRTPLNHPHQYYLLFPFVIGSKIKFLRTSGQFYCLLLSHLVVGNLEAGDLSVLESRLDREQQEL